MLIGMRRYVNVYEKMFRGISEGVSVITPVPADHPLVLFFPVL